MALPVNCTTLTPAPSPLIDITPGQPLCPENFDNINDVVDNILNDGSYIGTKVLGSRQVGLNIQGVTFTPNTVVNFTNNIPNHFGAPQSIDICESSSRILVIFQLDIGGATATFDFSADILVDGVTFIQGLPSSSCLNTLHVWTSTTILTAGTHTVEPRFFTAGGAPGSFNVETINIRFFELGVV